MDCESGGAMAVHRSETLTRIDGSLLPVTFTSLFNHEGPIRDVVINLKYGQDQSLARDIAQMLSPFIAESNEVDVITWAPTSPLHHKERGFDHSELIARHCAALTRVAHRKLLRRLNNEHQTGQGRQVRLEQPQFVSRPIRAQRVCVIDDVMTTGATLRAAAQALINSGATSVWCVSLTYVKDS
jgi:predicted amidophosphoribosyltransferase